MNLSDQYKDVRARTEMICKPLKTEDYVVQPVVDVSPPKWHLGHTSWFFETFLLKPHVIGYKEFDPDYNFVFNSYYETVGARVIRTNRGNLSRPTVEDIYLYRNYVDAAMHKLLAQAPDKALTDIVILGLNHEEQHQELLFTDIKYILGHNPLFPAYLEKSADGKAYFDINSNEFIEMAAGIYEIGHYGNDFCFDNELARHKVYLQDYKICKHSVTNKEYLDFMMDGGYRNHEFWHAEGWDWVKNNHVDAPMYWHFMDGEWYNYTFYGIKKININEAVCHISFYEASAYAAWMGKRLPTEFEWEAAAGLFPWGCRWDWTNSAYLPYPGFKKAVGAIGEYNGKFMVNQMVLRGGSEVTPPGHSRISYRNFFHPYLRWQFTGIRLAE